MEFTNNYMDLGGTVYYYRVLEADSMKPKITEIELLAILENLRISHPNDDYILRVASAIVAKSFGYNSRADWTEKVREAELVEYGPIDSIEKAQVNYKKLMDNLDSARRATA